MEQAERLKRFETPVSTSLSSPSPMNVLDRIRKSPYQSRSYLDSIPSGARQVSLAWSGVSPF